MDDFPKNRKTARFYQPSSDISLDRLLYNRRILILGFIFSIFVHFSIFGVIFWKQMKKEASEERLKMGVKIDFIVRKRPLESRKFVSGYRAKVRRKARRVIMGKVPSVLYHSLIGKIDVISALDSLSFTGDLLLLPTLEEVIALHGVPSRAYFDRPAYLPELVDLKGVKEPEGVINLLEELLSIEDLDFGRYQSMVFPDPNDRQKVKGFIYLKNIIGERFGNRRSRTIIEIREALLKWTKIRARAGRTMDMSDRGIMDAPFFFLAHKGIIEILSSEAACLKGSLENGGFVVFSATGDIGQKVGFRNSLQKALGRDYLFIGLRDTHFIYHSFFDLEGFPGDEVLDTEIEVPRKISGGRGKTTSIDGIYLDDQLVGIFIWSGMGAGGLRTKDDRAFVNIVVAAMLQRGSLTRWNTADFATGR